MQLRLSSDACFMLPAAKNALAVIMLRFTPIFSLVFAQQRAAIHFGLQMLSDVLGIGLRDSAKALLVVPFVNLGLVRSLVLLLRQFCHASQFKNAKVCRFSCFQKGWVQPCTVRSFKNKTWRSLMQRTMLK